jgi:ABC-type branched-subunit amino acid transport system permease subunit
MSRKSLWIIVLLLGLQSLLPLVGGAYALRIGTFASMYAILAVSWNVIGGMAGYPSFATAAFFGFGAYAGGILLAAGASLVAAGRHPPPGAAPHPLRFAPQAAAAQGAPGGSLSRSPRVKSTGRCPGC